MKSHTVAAVLLGLGSLAFTACSVQTPDRVSAATTPSPAPPPPAPDPIATERPFTVSGPLVVEHQLDLLAQRDGIVAKLNSDVGSRANAGDVLAELDDRQLTSEVEAARSKTLSTEAGLNSWKSEAKVLDADYERAKKLWDFQLIPLEQFEHAKYKAEEEHYEVQRVEQMLVTDKANQQSLELELEKTRVRAPFSGVVARRYVREGQQVARGDRLFWITGDGPLRMRFTMPERYIGRVKRGQELPLTTPDLPGQSYKARVLEVSPVVDPASSTFEVLVELQGTRGDLRPGMDANITLDTLR
ncbi:MAG TPA: efflux RND transporter periplasmic adaptor subunit [Candidatus Sulfotelmatobacter sp.]|nr:efflux RND transporter periplasmic adaptor subunit [Candidatus Sulfotelmatobacter sp.]